MDESIKIINTPTLNNQQKQFVMECWNTAYPVQLGFKGIDGLEGFLKPLGDPHHYLCIDHHGEMLGWAIAFIRDNERWFSIIVSKACHQKGIGRLLMHAIKAEFSDLFGWVIDHNNYVRADGEVYPSPMGFYLKQNFLIVPWKRLELPHLSAVQIKLNKVNSQHVLETERFILREMSRLDAANAYSLNLDPEVVKYTGDVAFESVEAAGDFLVAYDHYKKYGFGRWAVIDKSTLEYLGWCGLKFNEDKKEIDLGYRFFKKYWGQGIATETAQACLAYGFNQLNMPFIVANAMKANPASVRVMQKIGMKYKQEDTCGTEPGVQYIIYPQDKDQ